MVEDNFDDAALKDNVQNSEAVVIDPVDDSKEYSQSNEETEVIESGVSQVADVDSFSIIDEKINNVEIDEEAIIIDDDDDEPGPQICASTLKVGNVVDVLVNHNELVEKDSHVDETSDCYIEETVDESNGVIAKISSIASAGIKVENVDKVIERDRTKLDDEQTTAAYAPYEMLPVISTITSAGIKVEKNLVIPNDTIDNNVSIASVEDNIENVHQSHEITEALPVISTVSSKGVKVEMSTEVVEDKEDSKKEEPNETEQISADDSIDIVNKPTDSLLVEKDDVTVNDLEEFDIPMDLNFADEGIDFGDDGIAYVEEDEDDIITIEGIIKLKRIFSFQREYYN